ncbi:MAG: ABC transporter ATP-binding protein [Proteobacteria bacterium]|nr:ABC transporter ATP-binding protein [Pseudomonadota bacterium]MBU1715140.1 ABC transporter ATP-binding protein [Pseudomonadota bacterium]
MSNNHVIKAVNLGKCYPVYKRPIDRLKQALWRNRKTFFNEFWALKDVSFAIEAGETVGIIGSNGSGKSTLLQMICNTLTPTTGELAIDGRISALLELGAGFNLEFSGRDNVYTTAAIMGLSHSQITACYDDIVEFAGIGRFIDQPVKQYSSGMYVRLAFATAINVSPDILIVDEALSVGDVRFQQKCMARIKDFCKKGTVIFVSHDTAAIIELCSRAIWLKDGMIQADGTPRLVVEKYLQYMSEEEGKIEETIQADVPVSVDLPPQNIVGPDLAGVEPKDGFRQFGDQRVTITEVRMLSEGSCNSTVLSGKPCVIEAVIEANSEVSQPIIGYNIKDRLGREILGDNTAFCEQNPPPLIPGSRYQISFHIEQWPNLLAGQYVLSLAVADGTKENHRQCHWIHDVVPFTSVPVRKPGGLFSVLDAEIKFNQLLSDK